MKKRILSLMLGALLALSPMASLAEGAYLAGELTKTAVSDSYIGGNQINLSAAFDLTVDESMDSARAQAAASLLEKTNLTMSFYDDFGTARIHAELDTDGVTLLKADALVYENGSVQMMTSLTGNMVLALPEGSVTADGLDLGLLAGGEAIDPNAPFEELPAFERLRITTGELGVMLLNTLLGWTSGTQMETGNLYAFDDTYFDATETRDAVAQRMIGTIEAKSFTKLYWYIAASICDDEAAFQQALADSLAELGVTRYQVRQVVDALLTRETIDPVDDWVQLSSSVPDDGALCEYDDVSYFFKKLFKSSRFIYDESTDNVLSLVVSYDDYGETVGLDAELPKFTQSLPYEGTFTYSLKTDESMQESRTAHGELLVTEDDRLVGDLLIRGGEDVNGVNASELNGALDLVRLSDGVSAGFGVNAALTYELGEEDGQDAEAFSASAALSLRADGEGEDLLTAAVDGRTVTDGDSFALTADATLGAAGLAALNVSMTLEQAEYEEIAFAGGQAIDLTKLDDAQLERIKSEAVAQGAKLSLSLIAHPGVIADLMTLIGE